MVKWQKIKRLNHFLKNSLGGHSMGLLWTLLCFPKFMDFSFFGILGKNGLLA